MQIHQLVTDATSSQNRHAASRLFLKNCAHSQRTITCLPLAQQSNLGLVASIHEMLSFPDFTYAVVKVLG
jgi:hypothetical protein